MNEFRETLDDLIKQFKSIYLKYSLESSPKNLPFYEYITWLLRIYFDTTLEIKSKVDRLNESEYIGTCKVNSMSCKMLFRLESLFNKSVIAKLLSTLSFEFIGILFLFK